MSIDYLTKNASIPRWLLAALFTVASGIFATGIFYGGIGATHDRVRSLSTRVNVISDAQIGIKAQVNNQSRVINHIAQKIDSQYIHQSRNEASIAAIQATLKQINARLSILIQRTE